MNDEPLPDAPYTSDNRYDWMWEMVEWGEQWGRMYQSFALGVKRSHPKAVRKHVTDEMCLQLFTAWVQRGVSE